MKTPAIVGMLSLLFTLASGARGATITEVPELTDEILANPGMGWQTFHRTARQDKTLPDWIPSTVHYARWGWGELEPEPGTLNVEFLDRVLAESRESGQRLAFRVMCASTYKGRPYQPPAAYLPPGPRDPVSDPADFTLHLSILNRRERRGSGSPRRFTLHRVASVSSC